jgi:hypothetical protein
MRCYGKILSVDNDGRPARWFVELADDGTPRLDFRLIPVVPAWTIRLPFGTEDKTAHTMGEMANLCLQVMHRAPMRK